MKTSDESSREHHARLAVLQHVVQSLSRIGRIKRHVCPACLQHRQNRHHHLHATLQADRDSLVGPYPQATQMARQLVSARVERQIAHLATLMLHRNGLRRGGHLPLEQLVDAHLRVRPAVLGVVPGQQHLSALGLTQHLDLPGRCLRCLFQRLD